MDLPPSAPADGSARRSSTVVYLALAAVLAAGMGLRLIWLEDIEYKADEKWTWQHAKAAAGTQPIAWVGMPTSAGLENPGMSLWAFIPLARLSDGPVELARGVAWLSIAAIVIWIAFACRLPPAEREPWLWAAALYAVNPLAVLHHRKIWPNCLYPSLIALLILCWYRRERRTMAFAWGVLGSIVTQINLSAGFFSLAFVLWAGLADRTRVAWKSWFAGSVLASLPLVPWFYFLQTESTQASQATFKLARLLECKFLTRWLTEPLGFGLDHALGEDYIDFLRQPLIAGVPSWLVALLHVVALVLGLTIAWRWFRSRRGQPFCWRRVLFPDSYAALVSSATFWGYGTLLTLTCLPLHRHYMIIAYPVELLWLAYLAIDLHRGDQKSLIAGRKSLAGLVCVQFLLSASFLNYVHAKGAIDGDYGVALSAQQRHTLAQPKSAGQSAVRKYFDNGRGSPAHGGGWGRAGPKTPSNTSRACGTAMPRCARRGVAAGHHLAAAPSVAPTVRRPSSAPATRLKWCRTTKLLRQRTYRRLRWTTNH